MGRRKEPRIKMVLPAKLWTEAEGPFPLGQSCVTQNITRHGVCIEGVPSLKVGQTITLSYHQKKSRFRVAWVGAPGSSQAKLAGLENLEPEKLLFGVGFPESPDTYVVPAPKPSAMAAAAAPAWDGKERRASPRYGCSGDVQVREQGSDTFTSAKLADISLGGCYVETMAPFKVGSALQLVVSVNDLQIWINGMVRVCHRDGMGVQFTESVPEEQARLTQLLNGLAHGAVGSPGSAPAPVAASFASGQETDAAALVDALQKWFGSHDTLSRDEFRSMLTRSRKRS